MNCIRRALVGGVLVVLASLGAWPAGGQQGQPQAATGQVELKTVDNPGGGQFAYGQLAGQRSEKDGLVYMLRMVHKHFGDKPRVGKLMQSRDGSSLAAFFTLQAKTMHQQQLAGLVVISMPEKGPAKGEVQGAVLYDEAKNFATTEPSMMKALTSAWKGSLGGEAAGQGVAAARSSAVPQLFAATGGDRSAMIKMPASWQLTHVSGGGLMATGDRGEMVAMGMIYQNIINPQNPQAQRLISGPMAARGPKLICPLTSNLFSDYVCVVNQVRRNNGTSPGTFNYVSTVPQPAASQGAGRPVVVLFTVDYHDGTGLRNGSVWISMLSQFNPRAETWAIESSTSSIPQKYGSAVDPTLKAVVQSYSQDARVVASEGASDVERIRQQGIRNQAQTDAINGRREASTRSYNDHMQTLKDNDAFMDKHNADIDWQSKINQDYILDRTVIRDAGDNWHATVSNDLADALIRSNPTRLEQVPNQQLIQGVDY